MNLGERLDAYRKAFARGPVGRWSTAQGSFDVMMGADWEFLPDGTGKITHHSALFGASDEHFLWRSVGNFRIELDHALDPEDDAESDADGEEESWMLVEYEFVILEHDAGCEVVMRQANAQGFWFSPAPLRRDGADRA